jgi:signal transduction histidine kinase
MVPMRLRPRAVTLLAALLAGGLTDLIVLVPSLRFAYRSVPLHAMLETAATLIALLTTFLLWGRLRERKRLEDLLLFLALGVFSVANLFFATVPAAFWTRPHPFSTWTTVAASALGGVLLALAALVPTRRLKHLERATAKGAIAVAVVLALLAVAVWQSLSRLPAGIDPGASPDKAHLAIVGSGVIVAAQGLIALLFTLSAVGFTRRAETDQDELLLWLGAGSAVAAVARINYFMFPSLYSEWVYTGDAFRLAWHVLLFVGAAREIQIYQRAYAESRVIEERRRIARDVHDGLAQELAFIAGATRRLMEEASERTTLQQIASAAQRGLDESRRAIATLARKTDDPFDVALAQTVEEVAQRFGTNVEFAAEPIGDIPVDEQEQLLRIVREAVSNAGRHAGADVVKVTCTNGGPLRVRIEDDGSGFDPQTVDETGFGLVAMRERAAAIGAQLEIASVVGRGTSVEVRV